MCGPSQQEKDIAASQKQAYDTLTSSYQTTFGQQQAITSSLTNMFTPILNAGPTQGGYSPDQLASLNTQAGEKVATDYAQAQRATANILAARGGGNTLLPDSTTANATAATANAAAQARSQAQNQITQNNYAQGYQNWQNAAGVLSNTANIINPLGYAGQSTTAGQAASSTAQAMAAQSNSIWNAAIGALGGIGGAALGNPSGLMSAFKGAPSLPYSTGANNPAPIYSSAPSTSMIPYLPTPTYGGTNA
jgi:hypothetical protein